MPSAMMRANVCLFNQANFINPLVFRRIMDYKALGFKCGIEIHQELNTRKLFCNCSSALSEKRLVSEVRRKLRAVAGETGIVDLAAQYEFFRDRVFVYHGYEGEFCLVDTDSEPPHPVDPDAMDIALGVAKLLKLNVPDQICVMRKTITDGSAVSGFQRTMLVGTESHDSFLPETGVKVFQLNLEEDACKIEKKEGDITFYSLSRQGIPLVEIGTDATVRDPEHAKEVALEIGTILRSFDVRRGIGTIRQDVNVSIAEGSRVEVKGWQDLRTLPKLVENEVMRQVSLVEIKKELHARGLAQFSMVSIEATDIFKASGNRIIQSSLKSGGHVIALLLPKFAGLLKKELCPGKTFGKELSEYAKAQGTKGMIHTDEDLSRYGLEEEFKALRHKLGASEEDLIIVIAEHEPIASKAVKAVYERALFALEGVPEETRIPNHQDATSSYARPLPGAHRLYPETDTPMIDAASLLPHVKVPELLQDRIARISKTYSLDSQQVRESIREGIDIDSFVKRFPNVEPRVLLSLLVETPKEIKKRYGVAVDPCEHEDVFYKLDRGEITRDAVLEILSELGQGRPVDYSKYSQMDDAALESEIRKIIGENKAAPPNAMVGIVMGKMRGKADGRKIVEMVRKLAHN